MHSNILLTSNLTFSRVFCHHVTTGLALHIYIYRLDVVLQVFKNLTRGFDHKWFVEERTPSSTEMSILVTAIRSGNLEVVKEKFSRPVSLHFELL